MNPIKERDLYAVSEYQKQLYKNPELTYLFLELTNICNLNCIHCGSNCSNHKNTVLDYRLIQKALNDVAAVYDSHRIIICLTGGEPVIHPELERIIEHAKRKGFLVGITTNATLVSKEKAKSLSSAGLDTVAVSLDGLETSHDNFRRMPGAFQRAMEGIHNFRTCGIDPQAVTVVHKGNLNELDQLYSFLDKDNFESWRITTVEPIGRAKNSDKLILNREELKAVFDFIRNKRFDNNCDMEVTYGCAHFVGLNYEREIRDFYFQCGAGTKVASIRANGDIVACLDIEDSPKTIQGNIKTDNFINIWENKFSVFRQDRSEVNSVCKTCKNKNSCHGDAAHTWDFEKQEFIYCISKIIED